MSLTLAPPPLVTLSSIREGDMEAVAVRVPLSLVNIVGQVRQTYDDLDEQYNHYILAPLVMLGIEGMLQTKNMDTDLPELLANIHKGEAEGLFGVLKKLLSPAEYERVKRWIAGQETIDLDLIEKAVQYYNAQ